MVPNVPTCTIPVPTVIESFLLSLKRKAAAERLPNHLHTRSSARSKTPRQFRNWGES